MTRCSPFLVNRHTTWYRSSREVGHLQHGRFLVFALHFPLRNIGLQAVVEVQGTHNRVDDCDDDEDYGNDSKCGKWLSGGQVACSPYGVLVHSDELEEKVCKAPEIEHLYLETVSRFIFLRHKVAPNAYNN